MKKKPDVPEVDGIDLDYTPSAYFAARDLHLALPSDIQGQARREWARDLAAKGEALPPELAAPVLSEEARRAWGAIHPMLMGGEYLPPMPNDEVEIARISLASVTGDQISVRAGVRRRATRIPSSTNTIPRTNTSWTRRHRARRCRCGSWSTCWTAPATTAARWSAPSLDPRPVSTGTVAADLSCQTPRAGARSHLGPSPRKMKRRGHAPKHPCARRV